MDEWHIVCEALMRKGVAGAEDLGRFVNNVEFFRPSALDERAAMPVFLELLPHLTDAKLVSALAGHLRRPWARPAAFEPLHEAFRVWAQRDGNTGWALGDAMANAARAEHLPLVLQAAGDKRYGKSRQMVVHALSRFKKSPDVTPALIHLLVDDDVALHAMGALRRTIGPAAALPYLRDVAERYEGHQAGQAALREIRKAEKANNAKRASP